MEILVTVILTLLAISLHELGHYEAIRRCGMKVQEVSLFGIPLKWLPSWSRNYKDTTWSVHPFFIGAYVRVDPKYKIEHSPIGQQLYIHGNGITVNLVYGGVLLALSSCLKAIQDDFAHIYFTLFFGVVAASFWWGRRYIVYIFPLLTIASLCLIAYVILGTTPSDAVDQKMGGPIAIVKWLIRPDSIADALKVAGIMSINLAVINVLPLSYLDGGKIAATVLTKFFGPIAEKVFNWVTLGPLIALLIYIVALDMLHVVHSLE